jgi:hypothetical protein
MSEYTAERAEHRANHFENAGILDIAAMLRAYAATLRQQATNSPEIGSKLVGCVTELAGYVDPEQVADMQKNGGGVSIGSFSERYGRTHPVYYLRAPSQQAERGDGADGFGAWFKYEFPLTNGCADGGDMDAAATRDCARRAHAAALEAVAPLLRAPEQGGRVPDAATVLRFFNGASDDGGLDYRIMLGRMKTALGAAAPMLRAPAEQGGRVDDDVMCSLREVAGKPDDAGWVSSIRPSDARAILAALAQNAQGDADCWRVIINGEYQLFDTRDEARKARAKYEGNREGCLHYEPEPLYLHAERTRVPAVNGRRFVAWMIDNREGCRVTEEGLHGWLAEFLREESAAPSQPEDAA